MATYSLEGTAVGDIATQLVALREISGNAAFREIFSRQLKGVEYRPR
jgi:rhamnulokinase